MVQFESLLILLLAALLLAAAARRFGVPYPAFLAMGGVVLAFIPGAPAFVLDPSLMLALFVAPVLLDAAYDSSPRDLRDNWAPLTALVLGAVFTTALAVAWVARLLVPQMPWAAAIAIGAIVAPPDAAAAIAVLRQVRPPFRVMTVLEGESLLNDATALLIYRLAVGAVVANAFSFTAVAPTFLLAVLGSIVAGPSMAWLTHRVMLRVEDIPTAIVMQFITTIGVWMIADRIGLSPVLTMVAYAITVARWAPETTPARVRVPSYAVWDTVVFVLNVLAFILIGLQIRPILGSLAPAVRVTYFYVAGAVLITAIVIRVVWVMFYNLAYRMQIRWKGFHPRRPMSRPTVGTGLVISWCGMRGIVTLAAALALPMDFPFRGLAVLTAFCVVLGTLVIQGLTLKPLLLWLDLHDDDPVGKEVAAARARALMSAMASFSGDTSHTAEIVRQEYVALLGNPATRDASRDGPRINVSRYDEIRRRALASARQAVSQMRANDEIGDDAFHRLEEELDFVEMSDAMR